MNTFSIKVLPESLTNSSLGHITGKIHVKADDIVFPESDWDDFVVIILGWWLQETRDLLSGQTKECSCKFMDGPLMFNIEAIDSALWRVRFVRRRELGDDCIWEGTFASSTIIESLLSSGLSVIKLCKEKKWSSTDITTLTENYEAICNKYRWGNQ